MVTTPVQNDNSIARVSDCRQVELAHVVELKIPYLFFFVPSVVRNPCMIFFFNYSFLLSSNVSNNYINFFDWNMFSFLLYMPFNEAP